MKKMKNIYSNIISCGLINDLFGKFVNHNHRQVIKNYKKKKTNKFKSTLNSTKLPTKKKIQ